MAPDILDRAAGALIGAAVGDALGAGYEFQRQHELVGVTPVFRDGTFHSEPGEWTDDTAMTWCIAEAAAWNRDLLAPETLDRIARNFDEWAFTFGRGIGKQTRNVVYAAKTTAERRMYGRTLRSAELLALPGAEVPVPTAAEMLAESRALYRIHPDHSAGNGSLMRTSPVALAYLHDDDEQLVAAAMAVSELTHGDPVCGEACALWCLGIRHAILTGKVPNLGQLALNLSSSERIDYWQSQIEDAEQSDPNKFTPNGWVVNAFKAAWSSIFHTPQSYDSSSWFRDVLFRVIRIGHDTDTTACIAGALAGAIVGGSNIQPEWVTAVHGYPGVAAGDLTALAAKITSQIFQGSVSNG